MKKDIDKQIHKHKRRDCHSQPALHVPDCTVSLRTIIDRTASGLPINAKVSKHVALPPDGDNMDDFETGTEQYLDLVDVQHLSEDVEKHYSEQQKKQKEAQEAEKKKQFDLLVEQEVAKRLDSTPLNTP